jgi:hypothetical protein
MSDEERKDEETEVEGHVAKAANEEPADEGEVEGHVMKSQVIKAQPSKS